MYVGIHTPSTAAQLSTVYAGRPEHLSLGNGVGSGPVNLHSVEVSRRWGPLGFRVPSQWGHLVTREALTT